MCLIEKVFHEDYSPGLPIPGRSQTRVECNVRDNL